MSSRDLINKELEELKLTKKKYWMDKIKTNPVEHKDCKCKNLNIKMELTEENIKEFTVPKDCKYIKMGNVEKGTDYGSDSEDEERLLKEIEEHQETFNKNNKTINEKLEDLYVLRNKDINQIITKLEENQGSKEMIDIFKEPNLTKPFNLFDEEHDIIMTKSDDDFEIEEYTKQGIKYYKISNIFGELKMSVFNLGNNILLNINNTIISKKILEDLTYCKFDTIEIKDIYKRDSFNRNMNPFGLQSQGYSIKLDSQGKEYKFDIAHMSLFQKVLTIIQEMGGVIKSSFSIENLFK